MATDNAAIHIDTDDERGNDEIYQSTIEGEKPSRPPSIRDSMQRLIPIDVRSVPSSVHSSLKSQKLLCTQCVDLIKSFFLNTKLFWITVTFTFLGGYIFMWLEIPADLAAKERALEHHLIARDVLLWRQMNIQN
ncbi:Protein CBR-TWK-11 [Aphelenchoides besseyi]|nr:Protein CBR-TWK-11 [Aphelenchoides besseyi]